MVLSITTRELDNGTVEISPRGEVDSSNAHELRAAVDGVLTEAAVQRILLNLWQVTLLDSAGIGALVASHGAAARRGALFIVTHPSPMIHRQLRVSGVAALVGTP